MQHPRTVTILNPQLGCPRYAKAATAQRWVQTGRAHWTDSAHTRVLLSPQLRQDIAGHRTHQLQAAAASYDAILNRNSPTRPPLKSGELRRIPIVGNATRLLYTIPKARPATRAKS